MALTVRKSLMRLQVTEITLLLNFGSMIQGLAEDGILNP